MMDEQNTIENDVYKTLRGLDLLRGISDANLRELSKLGKPVGFPEGTIIFRNHEPAVHCYVITDGRVSLEVCGSAVGCAQILTVSNGELLGWSPLLGLPFLTATAKTNTPTKAIQFSGQQIIDLCEQQPKFGYQFMRCTALALASRLTATRLQLLDMFRDEASTPGKFE
jgi:CRP-like cAMP-binding protein